VNIIKSFLLAIFLWAAPFCHADLAEHIRFQPQGKNLVGYLDIPRDRGIDQATYLYVKFALEEYVKQGVCFVLLHLDTPGGEVFASTKIADLLQKLDVEHHIPVVAVIDNWALSAGAMLAYSCRFIAVTSSALMGAAEPIMAGAEGKIESAPEKIVSALRAEFASLAKSYGRNPLLAESMVDKDIMLVKRGGDIVQLHEESAFKRNDQWITKHGKLLTLDAEQLINLKVANFQLPKQTLFSYPFFAQIPDVQVVTYSDWKIDFFAFLTHPLVASLLMMGLVIGVYMEMTHPGFGVPGVIALTSLALILISNFASQVISWLEVLFVVAGILLFLVELFILPGFGVVGALGIILILFGLIAMMLPSLSSVQFSWDFGQWNLNTIDFFEKLTYYSGALIFSFLAIVLISRYITPRLMKRSRLVLHEDQEGSRAGPENAALLVGAEGEAWSPLRPGGRVMVAGRLYDAMAEMGLIEKGEKVVVVKIQGSGIIVAKKPSTG
jgi:membrane-bound serine protease (ClpP class)